MENIQIFLDASEAYGVQKTSLFQTVDLFEARNMSQVINTIMQLGTEVYFFRSWNVLNEFSNLQTHLLKYF